MPTTCRARSSSRPRRPRAAASGARAPRPRLGPGRLLRRGGLDLRPEDRREELGDRAVALTAISASVAPDERREARGPGTGRWASGTWRSTRGEMADPRYAANPGNRCYFCKTELYALCRQAPPTTLGPRHGAWTGSTPTTPRTTAPATRPPGRTEVRLAAGRGGARQAGDPRLLARRSGCRTWDKPQMPCLASRIPYGTAVTPERLVRIGAPRPTFGPSGSELPRALPRRGGTARGRRRGAGALRRAGLS